MVEVLLINGPAGVGKTTVASRLKLRVPGTVCVHGDQILAFSPPDVRVHLGAGSTFRAGAALVREYVEMNAPRVLFDYVFSNAAHISRFCRWLAPDTMVHVFTIWAPLEAVRQREAARTEREPLGARVIETYATLQENLSQLGWLTENVRTPDDAVDDIERILRTHPGRRADQLVAAEK